MYFGRVLLQLLVFVSLASLAPPDSAEAENVNEPNQSSYRLQSTTMGAAGARGSSTGFKAKSTIAQPTPIGKGTASDNLLYAGFWAKPWVITGILESDQEPLRNTLYQNYPNPFKSSTSIAYSVNQQTHVEISVFNVRGQKVRTLVSGGVPPGKYVVAWDCRGDRGEDVSPGVYFYRMRTGSYIAIKKLVLFR
jgi:hypothetical protein